MINRDFQNHSHVQETRLALFASGDLPLWQHARTSWHVRSCSQCHELVEDFRAAREQLRMAMDRLPATLDTAGANESAAAWNRLAAEMTANIRLGLEAGECIAPFEAGFSEQRQRGALGRAKESAWRPAFVGAGIAFTFMLVLGTAWWLNVPASDVAILQRAFSRMAGNPVADGSTGSAGLAGSGPLVEASPKGIEFRENGGSMGMALSGSAPVAVSVSFEGSASAHYVDADTGQVTVNTVYAQ